MIAEGFIRDHLLLRASALAYFTALSLIPMLAVVIAIIGAIGVRGSGDFVEVIVQQVAGGSPEAQAYIVQLIENANFGSLGTMGAIALFLTTVFAISNIETSLNEIWGVTRHRSWSRRFPDYLAVLVVAPLLLVSALSLMTTLQSQGLVKEMLGDPEYASVYHRLLEWFPALALSVGFAFLYWILPNTRVSIPSALLGGAVAGVLVFTVQRLYLKLNVGVARYDALFGGFSAISPALCMDLSLLGNGAVRCRGRFRLPEPRSVSARGTGKASDPGGAGGHRLEDHPQSCPQLSGSGWGGLPRISSRTASRFPYVRCAKCSGPWNPRASWRRGISRRREGGYQLGRPAEDIAVLEVVGALRGSRATVAGDPEVRAVVSTTLSEMDEGASKVAAGRTLADLLGELPRVSGRRGRPGAGRVGSKLGITGAMRVYLDHNATTPVRDEVVDLMTHVLRFSVRQPIQCSRRGRSGPENRR